MHDIQCPSEPDTPQGLELVGCALSTSTHNVRRAYAECQLEVPMGLEDIGVVVRGQDNCHLYGRMRSGDAPVGVSSSIRQRSVCQLLARGR